MSTQASRDRAVKVVAIQNYGPSGSMLLHSLLDGHPQVLTLPGLYPIGFHSAWRTFAGGVSGALEADDVIAFLMNWIRPLYEIEHLETDWGLKELGERRDEHCCVRSEDLLLHLVGALDAMGLREILASPNEPSAIARQARKVALLAVFRAYARCLALDTDRRDTLVYPAHSSEIQDLRDLAEDFPDMHVLHTVRDPVDGLFSTVKHNLAWQNRFSSASLVDPFMCAVVQMTMDRTPLVERTEPFHALTPFAPAVASRSRAVRLEDLHRAPEATLRTVADWAGLTWNPVLLQSTFAGRKWWNRPGLHRVSGFRPGMGRAEGITAFDQFRIAAATAPIRRRFGYERAHQRARISRVLALFGLAVPFAVERTTSNPLRNYALFIARGPFSLMSRFKQRRDALLASLIEERMAQVERSRSGDATLSEVSLAWVRDVITNSPQRGAKHGCPSQFEWWAAGVYGRAYVYCSNRYALLTGWLGLRRQTDWVELLTSSPQRESACP